MKTIDASQLEKDAAAKEALFMGEKTTMQSAIANDLTQFKNETDPLPHGNVDHGENNETAEPPLYEKFSTLEDSEKKEALLALTGEEVKALIQDMAKATGNKNAFLDAMQSLKFQDQLSPNEIRIMVREQVAKIDPKSLLLGLSEKEPEYDCEHVRLVDTLNDYGKIILDQRQEIMLEYIVSTMVNESTLYPYNVGVDADCGLGQPIAFWFGGNNAMDAWNPFQPEEAIMGMIGIFEYMAGRRGIASWDDVLTAYNAGEKDVQDAKKQASKNELKDWKQYLEKDVAKIYTRCVQARRQEIFKL